METEKQEKLLTDIEQRNLILQNSINENNGRNKDDRRKIEEIYSLRFLRLLGRGSYGQVFECHEQKTNSSKALKILKCDKEGLRQFLDEIDFTFQICKNYPGIIPKLEAYDYFYDKTTGFQKAQILMEMNYCNLFTLGNAKFQAAEYLTESELFFILEKASYLFMQLESAKIAHRDIKPENMMINEKFEVIQIIDIGEGYSVNPQQKDQLIAVGSPLFMAPEIYLIYLKLKKEGIEETQEGSFIKSDVYSLGVSMLQIYQPTIKRKQLNQVLNKIQQVSKYMNFYEIVKEMLEEDYDKRPSYQHIYNQINELYNNQKIQKLNSLILSENIKQLIIKENLSSSLKISFEENLAIIEGYASINKFQEGYNLTQKLFDKSITEKNYYKQIAAKCILIKLQSLQHNLQQIEQLLNQTLDIVLQAQLEPYQNQQKIRDQINKTSKFLLNYQNQEYWDFGILLHTQTFFTKGKNVQRYNELIFNFIEKYALKFMKSNQINGHWTNINKIISEQHSSSQNNLVQVTKIYSQEELYYLLQYIKAIQNIKDIKAFKVEKLVQDHTKINLIMLKATNQENINQQFNINSLQSNSKIFNFNQQVITSKKVDKNLDGHTKQVFCLVLIPNTQYICSGSEDMTIKIWDINSKLCLQTLQGHTYSVCCLTVITSKQYIASGGWDKTIKIWDYQQGKCLMTLLGHTSNIYSIISIQDSEWIVSASSDKQIKVWNIQNGTQLLNIKGHQFGINALLQIPNTSQIISGSDDRYIKIWNYKNGNCIQTLQGHNFKINSLHYIQTTEYFASGGGDSFVKIWNYKTHECTQTLEGNQSTILSLSSIPQKNYVVGASKKAGIYVWDYKIGQLILTLIEEQETIINSLIYLPNTNILMTGYENGIIKQWDISTQKQTNFSELLNNIYSITEIPGTNYFATAYKGSKIQIWDYQQEQYVSFIESDAIQINCLTSVPEKGEVICGCEDGKIRIYNYLTQQNSKVIGGHTSSIISILAIPELNFIITGTSINEINIWNIQTEQYIASLIGHSKTYQQYIITASGDKTIKIWSVSDYSCINTLNGHLNAVCCVAELERGQKIVSGSNDETIKVWNLELGECILTLNSTIGGIKSLVIIPDSKYLVCSGDNNNLSIWRYDQGEYVQTLRRHTKKVNCLIIANQYLISAGDYNEILKWDYQSIKQHEILKGHSNNITSLVKIPDSKQIVSGSWDSTIKIWNYSTNECIATLTGHTQNVNAVIVIPETIYIASASSDLTIKIWNYETYECIKSIQGHSQSIKCLVALNNTKYIASGANDSLIKIWNYETGECVSQIEAHIQFVNNLVAITGTKYIASTGADLQIKIWNYETEQCISQIQELTIIYCLAFISGTTFLVTGNQSHALKIWDYELRECISTLQGHQKDVQSVCSIQNSAYIVSGSEDYSIKIWNYKTNECLYTFYGHVFDVYSLLSIPDTDYLISGSWDRTIRVWNLKSLSACKTIKSLNNPVGLYISNSNEYIIICGNKVTQVNLSSIDTFKEIKSFSYQCFSSFKQDSKIYIGVGLTPFLVCINLDNNQEISSFIGHKYPVNCLTINNTKQHLFSGCKENIIKIWNSNNQQCLFTFNCQLEISKIQYITLNQGLAIGTTQGNIQVFKDVFLQNEKFNLAFHNQMITTIQNPDYNNKLLLSGSQDCLVILWNIESQTKLAIFDFIKSPITESILSKDTQIAFICYKNGCYAVWDLRNTYYFHKNQHIFKSYQDEEFIQICLNNTENKLVLLGNFGSYHEYELEYTNTGQ